MSTRYALSIGLFSLSISLFAQMSGTYTIGGASPDYATVADAMDAISNDGANGDVTFNIRPGTYEAHCGLVTLSGTPGTLTIRSESGDPADVTLTWDAPNEYNNYLFRLQFIPNVTFQGLTFAPQNADFARAILFRYDADQLTIDHCVFIGSENPSASGILVYCDQNSLSTTENPDNVSITNSTFRYGTSGVQLDFKGTGGARAQGLHVANNVFTDQTGLGLGISFAVGDVIGNTITSSVSNNYTGISTNNLENSMRVENNVVQAISTGSCTGMEIGNTQLTTDNRVANNMVYAEGTDVVTGLSMYNLWGMQVVHNTVVTSGAGAPYSRTFYQQSGFPDGQDTEVRDNIFVNYCGGPAWKQDLGTTIAAEDHNDLFSTGASLATIETTEYATLAAYQSGTGHGVGSVHIDPAFPFLPDLHLNSCALNDQGVHINGTTNDIDGQVRSANTPDIGADEFTFNGNSVNITLELPSSDLPYTLTPPLSSTYVWNTGSTDPSEDAVTAGVYFCLITDVNGCNYTVQWTVNVDFATGSGQAERVGEVFLFPNPVVGSINIAGLGRCVQYAVLDASGRRVMVGSTTGTEPIAVGGLVPGIHTLRLVDGAQVRTLRFVKE